MKQPLIIITGPTAVGKTEASILLAKKINGEIISADSMQVYKGMDIGTAKITKEEMMGVPHHLIDILSPDEDFNVYTFQQLAKAAVDDICSRGKIPILAGGTGFYIQALLYGISFKEEANTYRLELEKLLEEKGNLYLHAMLKEVDSASADIIHPNNVKRVIRALEFYQETGEPISKHNETERQKESQFQSAYFVLNMPRKQLYERINLRIDKMLEAGLVQEVAALKEMGIQKNMTSMQGIGYKEVLDYLNGETSYEDMVYLLKRDTRHFAKRQITWFKREKNVIWIDKTKYRDALELSEDLVRISKEKLQIEH
ncbi:MAG: tRNA (adenosine(37)-N6)-dimethylallyltransferase MiaA [Lachnospiraceae bacterium]|nr:tRNA (adenosine(37)-N6)-dimethylallyltransferase MiaA [Lachnospiraceae bacterium]